MLLKRKRCGYVSKPMGNGERGKGYIYLGGTNKDKVPGKEIPERQWKDPC